ncbi:MazG-like family protein [Microbispora sp. RL4-1S]|uniref:MazG-like family protein n=1 Tax=Microbispora oryzae TaxID=2806554 RepID=A0A940WF78_9ACTN|nr:MazG-like family protein [Microbispora oryzae]MBP2704435.1 MazG-like family protein [Microbispora oryzae]
MTAAPPTVPVWPSLTALVDWLNTTNGSGAHETSMRLLKLVEEAGEVAAAYIGTVGQNPRKGRTHTYEDVAAELCDVALTALVALHSFTPDPQATFTAHLAGVAARVGVCSTIEETNPHA